MHNMDIEREKQGREGRREKRRESLVAEMVHSPSTQTAELAVVHLIISISKRQLHTYWSHSAYLCSLFYSVHYFTIYLSSLITATITEFLAWDRHWARCFAICCLQSFKKKVCSQWANKQKMPKAIELVTVAELKFMSIIPQVLYPLQTMQSFWRVVFVALVKLGPQDTTTIP